MNKDGNERDCFYEEHGGEGNKRKREEGEAKVRAVWQDPTVLAGVWFLLYYHWRDVRV